MTPLSRRLIGAVCALLLSSAASAADYTMRLSHQMPPGHHVAKVIGAFAQEVQERSNGRLVVQIFGAEQLIKAAENHPAVARGQVEAASVVSLQWGGTIPEMQVMTIPFLMTDPAVLARFRTSEAVKFLDERLAARGVRNLAWLVDSTDAVFTSNKAPLVAPADFKGVKIRGLSRLVDQGLVAMGAAPAAMPGSEVYQALQTGVIDAGITGLGAVHSRRFYEVQRYGVVTPLFTVYQNIIVNPAWWDRLPKDLQGVLSMAAANAEQKLMPTSKVIDPAGVERLRAAGMQMHVHTPAEIEALRRAMQPAVMDAFRKASPDAARLLQLIEAL